MKAQHVFLLCVLGAALLSTVLCSNGIGPDDCCFKFYRRQIRKLNILTQTPNWNRRHICVDASLLWVKNMMRHLDEKDLK
uniref:Chemokine interleukin-8-like domain-containing protein n=1 Tax=Xiphophorus couchianus TaxID=32473 RepID=A0A3B5LCD2_9TELE